MFKFRDNYLKEDNIINISKTDSENYFILLKNFTLPTEFRLDNILFKPDSKSIYYNVVITNNNYIDNENGLNKFCYTNFKKLINAILIQPSGLSNYKKVEYDDTQETVTIINIQNKLLFQDLTQLYNTDIKEYLHDKKNFNWNLSHRDFYLDREYEEYKNVAKIKNGIIKNDNIKLLQIPPLNNNNDTIVLYYVTEKNDKIDIENYLKKFKLPEINEEVLLELE